MKTVKTHTGYKVTFVLNSKFVEEYFTNFERAKLEAEKKKGNLEQIKLPCGFSKREIWPT